MKVAEEGENDPHLERHCSRARAHWMTAGMKGGDDIQQTQKELQEETISYKTDSLPTVPIRFNCREQKKNENGTLLDFDGPLRAERDDGRASAYQLHCPSK